MTSSPATPPARWSKPFEWWLTRMLLRLMKAAGRAVSPRGAERLGRGFGGLAYRTMTRYRLVALRNLELAFGRDWSENQIRRTAIASFQHIGVTAVEFFLRQPRLTQAEVLEDVEFEGQRLYEEAFRRGNGVILVTAHYGNWEMMGPRLAAAGYRVNAVSRTADDPGTEAMIEATRSAGGVHQIPRRRAAREGLAALRRNEILAILLDQNSAEGGVFVPFFGHPASTATGPAVFALKTGAAILPTFCIRRGGGKFTIRVHDPVPLPPAATDRASAVGELTAAITAAIERQIREKPEQWCWLHNRWKRQPLPDQVVWMHPNRVDVTE